MREVLRGTVQALAWAVVRRRAVPPGASAFGYTSRIGVMLWVTIGLTPVEMGAVHLLLPWPAVRWVVFVLSVATLVGTVAFALALGQRPHTLDRDHLTLRFGFLREVVVPVADVVAVRPGTTLDHRRLLEVGDGEVALSVLGETSVRMELRPGATVRVGQQQVPAERVALFADDPRGLTAALRALVADRARGRAT
jgi:hypothetical protein